jgi:hypothetical protein
MDETQDLVVLTREEEVLEESVLNEVSEESVLEEPVLNEVLNEVKKQVYKPTREDIKSDIGGQKLDGQTILCNNQNLVKLEIVSSTEEAGNPNELEDDKYIFEVNIVYRDPDNLSEYGGQLTVTYKLNDAWSKWEFNQIQGDLREVFNASLLEKPNKSKLINDMLGSVLGLYDKEDTTKQVNTWTFADLSEFTNFQIDEYKIKEGTNPGEYILKVKVNCGLQEYENGIILPFTGDLNIYYTGSKSNNSWSFNKVTGKVIYKYTRRERNMSDWNDFINSLQ